MRTVFALCKDAPHFKICVGFLRVNLRDFFKCSERLIVLALAPGDDAFDVQKIRLVRLDREGPRDDLPGLHPGVPTANVRIMVPDVDAYWTRAVAGGAHVLAPIADRDYGLRDFTILDPDRLGLRFATRL